MRAAAAYQMSASAQGSLLKLVQGVVSRWEGIRRALEVLPQFTLSQWCHSFPAFARLPFCADVAESLR